MMFRLLFVTALLAVGSANAAISVRVLLGVGDTTPTNWDGELAVRGASITALEPWRFDADDAILPGNRWRMGTRVARVFQSAAAATAAAQVVVPNGVVVQLDGESENTELEVRTPRGNFTFRLSEIPYGTQKPLLNGAALVERVPAWTRITNTQDEQDYPAVAAGKSGEVWVAYLEFRHHPDKDKIRMATNQFDLMTAKPGGDQIFVKRLANGQWGDPIPVSASGGDLYRPAIAVDGQGRPWVFFSVNENNDFDIRGRVIENGRPGTEVRISKAAGSDIDPVAATDSNGHVVVAWQGWRNGRASIFSATQNGNGFSIPETVASSAGNEWNPAIAADKAGRVTVAWDSYRNGNYDVFLRTRNAQGKWAAESAAAASATYEAYPSIAYDPAGTLWVAYEEGAEQWGKDFGADNSDGVPVYEGRAIRLKGFTSSGALVETTADPGSVMWGVPARPVNPPGRQIAVEGWLKPVGDAWRNRPANTATLAKPAPKNTMPRLTVDTSGRIWLAYRSPTPIFWGPLGTVWTEYVVSYSGSQWTPSIYLHHSDNILDNRPALVSVNPGELIAIYSCDGRREFHEMAYMPGVRTFPNETTVDPYQNDLFASRILLGPATAPSVKPSTAASGSASTDRDRRELSAIAAMRAYRMKGPVGPLRIVRGEFHRHSEISMDGGNDGTLLDQYRYIIDAAHLDWVGCCDHDNGGAREYTWWQAQKLTDVFHSAMFVPMFSYERSVAYPEGHRNVIFAQRGIRPLGRLPRTNDDDTGRAPDTQMLYAYLKKFNGIVASHTSGTIMGTDWRDNDPDSEPAVEIYQGDRQNYEMPGAPRSNSEKDSIGGWRPKGFINLALERGYRLAFEASSDHVSTHMSYANILAPDNSRGSLLKAIQQRHIYAATDNILADFRSGNHIMGDVFSTAKPPEMQVKITGTSPLRKVSIIRNNQYVYMTEPGKPQVEFSWRDTSPEKGKMSYYYVRGEQENGEIVWISPMWITYTGN
jgi:hypothetical protein